MSYIIFCRRTIKGRVQTKSHIRKFLSKDKKEGKLFSFDIIDKTGINRCALFNDQVDKYYHEIEVIIIYFDIL